MTYADENRYPPPTPGRPRPHTAPQSYGHDAPRYEPYAHDAPRYDPYAHDAPRYEPYGQTPWDEPYGQAPWNQPHTHETQRRSADLTDLAALRSAYRLLRRISTLAALGSFVVYVVLSCYAPGLMGAKIAGELSLGIALGVLQLVVTFAAVFWYGRSAQRSVDPLALAVRERAVPTGRNAGVTR